MTTDQLDTLPDSDLSALFAVEVVGSVAGATSDSPKKIVVRENFRDGGIRCVAIPHYAADFQAVLPWLEGNGNSWGCNYETSGSRFYSVDVTIHHENGPRLGAGRDNTLARAACIALLRAGRAGKE